MSVVCSRRPCARWLVLAIVSVALLLIVMDMTVLYTALPRLTQALGASASEQLWIVNSYGLAVSGLLLGMGALGDRAGHKRLFMLGMGVFGLASLAAAYAPGPALLVAARAALGVGAAMMMPATLSILRLTFTDDRERAVAIGIWASVASGGAALGPVLGGLLLEHFWWGSVFLINVPIVLAALPLTARFVPRGARNASRPWDLPGSLQAMAGMILCAYGLKELGRPAPSYALAACAALAGAWTLARFARRQRRQPDPMVDFAIFRNGEFASAAAAALFAAAALLGMELAFSQRLQLVLGLSPFEAALWILPLPLAAFASGPLAGLLLPRLGSRSLLAGSLVMSALGMLGYLLAQDMAAHVQVTCLAVLGAGLGAAMTSASATIMQSAPPERAGMAASIEEVSYELGGALGVTLLGSLLSAVYARALDAPPAVPVPPAARDSLDAALEAARHLAGGAGEALAATARAAFDTGFAAVMAAAALLLLGGAALVMLNGRRA